MSTARKSPASLARHLGQVARQARTRAGLTQEEVAERMGLATEVYGRLERGHMLPRLPTLMRLCRTLVLDANALLGFASLHPPAWLLPTAASPPVSHGPPALRRLLRTLRGLTPRHLAVLGAVARALPQKDLLDARHAKRTARARTTPTSPG